MKTFYDLLNVSEDASIDEIKNSYENLKSKYEKYLLIPDRKENAEEILKKLGIAYKVLGNEETKQSYDRDLANMRNNELMNNLQKNTSEYNKEIEKQAEIIRQEELKEREIEKQQELELQEKQKKQAEEELQKRRMEAVKLAIENQVKEQKRQLETEKQNQKKIKKIIEKEYKRQVFKGKLNILGRKVLAVIVVLIILFILSRIPFIRNFFTVRFDYFKDLAG